MFFSVIVPVFQAEKTICRCLNSLAGQRFKDYEAILVDDGSSDNSGELCREFSAKDKRFRYVRKENGGPSSARNLGLDLAEGEFVVFLDSDDAYRETYLESFCSLIRENDDCDNFWCGYRTILANGAAARAKGGKLGSDPVLTFERGAFMKLHSYELLPPPWNKAFRLKIIRDHALRMKHDISLGEDLLFNLSYLDHCSNTKILLWNREEYDYYAVSKDSLSSKYRPDLDRVFMTLRREMLLCFRKWKAPEDQLVLYQTMVFYMLLQVIHNYDHPACTLPKKERGDKIREILHSDEFQDALRSGSISIHPLLKEAYRGKSVGMIRLLERMAEWKRRGR